MSIRPKRTDTAIDMFISDTRAYVHGIVDLATALVTDDETTAAMLATFAAFVANSLLTCIDELPS